MASQMATISECRYRWLRVLDLNLPPPTRNSVAAPFRRMQVLLLGDRRNYDPSIAGQARVRRNATLLLTLIGFRIACSTLAESK
jgi:hypothetical protein